MSWWWWLMVGICIGIVVLILVTFRYEEEDWEELNEQDAEDSTKPLGNVNVIRREEEL